jgi:hypothetical protein
VREYCAVHSVRGGNIGSSRRYYRSHSKLLLWTAVVYYGLVFGVGLIVSLLRDCRELQEAVLNGAIQGVTTSFPGLLQAYVNNPFLAIAYTFMINLVVGTMLRITLPGLILFPLAPLAAFYRAIGWGIIFAPTDPGPFLRALPILLAEGFGYVLAVVPSLRLGLAWVLPKRAYMAEQLTRKRAFRKALSELWPAYLIVSLTLLAAAVIEVASTRL